MHFLFLAALLQLSDYQPIYVRTFETSEDCLQAAKTMNLINKRIHEDQEWKEIGVQYICMKIIGNT